MKKKQTNMEKIKNEFRAWKDRTKKKVVVPLVVASLMIGLSSCGSNTQLPPGQSGGNTNPPVTNQPPGNTDQELQQARAAVQHFLEDILGLRTNVFKEEWKEGFAESISPYITTSTPTDNEILDAAWRASNNGDNRALNAYFEAWNLKLATELPLESVCGVELIRDGTSPAQYDVTTKEGTLIVRYNDIADGKRALGEGVEAYLNNRTGTRFDPLLDEVVEYIKITFSEAFAEILYIDPGGSAQVDKTLVHDRLMFSLSVIKK